MLQSEKFVLNGKKDGKAVRLDIFAKDDEGRGYDSAGVALLAGDHKMNIYKSKGKVSNLDSHLLSFPVFV